MGLISTWFVAGPLLAVLLSSAIQRSFDETNPMIEKSFESLNIPRRVVKKIKSLGHESLVWAHMSAFALIDAALMINRDGHDMHKLLCNSRRYLNSRLFQGHLFHYFLCHNLCLYCISLCLTYIVNMHKIFHLVNKK